MNRCRLPVCCSPRCWLLCGLAFVYFVIFPGDLEFLLTPVRLVLALTGEIALGAYLLAAAAVVCWTGVRITRRATAPRADKTPAV